MDNKTRKAIERKLSPKRPYRAEVVVEVWLPLDLTVMAADPGHARELIDEGPQLSAKNSCEGRNALQRAAGIG